MRTNIQVNQAKRIFSSGKFKDINGIKTRLVIYGLVCHKHVILPSEDEPEQVGFYRLICKQKIDGKVMAMVVITTQSIDEVIRYYMYSLQRTMGIMEVS